ncbi:hypothetical protein BY458DRAFT_513953 [Sporodiniella umbellata]|nr:hypothetical protein BY458DRAFT_513953 [Sporodiniella umbellata]
MSTHCIVLGHYSYIKPFCIYSIDSFKWLCLEDLSVLFFHRLDTAATLHRLYKANPHHFSRASDGRMFVMTPSVIQMARCFNQFYLAELCKLSEDELLGYVADPLLKCIAHDLWYKAQPSSEQLDLTFSPPIENEPFFGSLSETKTENKTAYNNASQILMEEGGKKQYRPITTTTIHLSSVLNRWLSTDVTDLQPNPAIAHTLQSVEKMKREQQAIIETRQLQAVFTAPPSKITRFIKDKPTAFPDIKRKKGAYVHYSNHKKPKHEKKSLPPPPPLPPQEHNLHLLASQATQLRGLPISPSLSPPTTPFLLQPMNNTKQPQKLPSIRAMLSDIPIPMDYFA